MHRMPVVGELRDFALHDFLYVVARGAKTGSLRLWHPDESATLYFDQGKLTSLVRPAQYERLGSLLIRLGKLTLTQLDAALDFQKSAPGQLLGQLLVKRGYIAEDELQAIVHMVIEEAMYELLSWHAGSFEWRAGERPAADEIQTPVPLMMEPLIMEGVRRIDETARIRERIPHDGIIFCRTEQLDDEDTRMSLTAEEQRVLAASDGHRDVSQTAVYLDLDIFEVRSDLFRLVTYGLIEWRGSTT